MDFATSQARNSLRTIKIVIPEPPFFDQTTFHFRRLEPCNNDVKMLRVCLVAAIAATTVMVVAPVKERRPTAAQLWYDGGGAAPNRFDLPTSNRKPASHHASASSVWPRCGRSAFTKFEARRCKDHRENASGRDIPQGLPRRYQIRQSQLSNS